jgi:putative FmdB family regulatory protein
LYEYACQKCGRHTDKIEPVNGPHLKKCPHCGGKVESVITAPAIKFKGSGWYVNDYAGKSSASDPAKAEGSSDSKSSKDSSSDASSKDSSSKDSSSSKDTSTKESSSKEKKSPAKKN